jgi:hypothetical protein
MTAALAIVENSLPLMSDQVKKGLLAAYSHLLRPLVRVLIRNGVAFGELAEAIKHVYVRSAAEDFAEKDKRVSGSRIAILTGLTRKDVKRILDAVTNNSGLASQGVNRAARVLEGWHQDPEFTGPYGIPLELPFDGPDISFALLVRRYSGDMPARAMLDELLRVGVVDEAQGKLKPLSRYFISSDLDPENAKYFGEVLHDLAATIEHNFSADGKTQPRFERWVTNDRLSEFNARKFHGIVSKLGTQYLETLDNWLSSNEIPELEARTQPIIRVRVGVYFYEEQDKSNLGGKK